MSDKVSNVSAGVESGRQASVASGAGGGRKDDKRDGRKPPRKGPSGVKKAQKRCYICRKTGHLQKDCPYQKAFREMVNTLMQDLAQPASAGQPLRAGPGPSRRRRTTSRVPDNGQQQQQQGQQQGQQQQDQQQNECALPDSTTESWADRMDEDEKSKIHD